MVTMLHIQPISGTIKWKINHKDIPQKIYRTFLWLVCMAQLIECVACPHADADNCQGWHWNQGRPGPDLENGLPGEQIARLPAIPAPSSLSCLAPQLLQELQGQAL